jgi:hypothetical protein
MARRVTKAELQAAAAAADNAETVRQLHRRRTKRGDARREKDIELALDRITSAMRPLRAYLCGVAWLAHDSEGIRRQIESVRAASRRLQSERRKLWKMQQR